MIETFFSADMLDGGAAFFAALLIGMAFGFALERAGFGSSRRIAGVFLFRDMTVVKVMFTALVTAMLGLIYLTRLGYIGPETIYLPSTIYGGQVVGGLIFGLGMAMAGWCPGTSMVGLASGKIDALIFLIGVILGSLGFNHFYALVAPVYEWGQTGVHFIYELVGLTRVQAAVLISLIAVAAFWISEAIESRQGRHGNLLGTPFLKAFSLAVIIVAGALFVSPALPPRVNIAAQTAMPSLQTETMLLAAVETASDHMEPEELADRMMAGDPGLLLVDVRPKTEYQEFHIRGAVNATLAELPRYLARYKNTGIVVLYSNGMTHPAQARDSLARLGFNNVYILTDGLKGFFERCLKPASLRSQPLEVDPRKIEAWRNWFYAQGTASAAATEPVETPVQEVQAPAAMYPGLVTIDWLARNLERPDLTVIDLRGQSSYNQGHIPHSIRLSIESLRGVIGGIPSMLLPASILAELFGRMGIGLDTMVVLVTEGRPRDATLVGMALERLGHRNYALLDRSVSAWVAQNHPMDTILPQITAQEYPFSEDADDFTVNAQDVLAAVDDGQTIILDVRPAAYFIGEKSDEARAGHIPGAVNRPYGEDLEKVGEDHVIKPVSELERAYAGIIPDKDAPVIIHCRTGHQASQTFFVMKHLLGYKNIKWYDAGWTEWATKPELPVTTGPAAGPENANQ